MTTTQQPQVYPRGSTVRDRVALVTGGARGIGADESAYITGQIWAVNGGLDM